MYKKLSLEEFLASTPGDAAANGQVAEAAAAPTVATSQRISFPTLSRSKTDGRRQQVVEMAEKGLLTQSELAILLNSIDQTSRECEKAYPAALGIALPQDTGSARDAGGSTAVDSNGAQQAAQSQQKQDQAYAKKQRIYDLKAGWALQTPALESLQQARGHRQGGTDVLFVIRRSSNRNIVVYNGEPQHGVGVKWIMFDKAGAPTGKVIQENHISRNIPPNNMYIYDFLVWKNRGADVPGEEHGVRYGGEESAMFERERQQFLAVGGGGGGAVRGGA